jgi:hypothetical protein
MAKMFYTAEEAAEKLGKSVEEVMEMASSGEIQSFKQDDQDMFRVEQIDMLSEDDDLGDIDIALDDSAVGDPLGLSGSAAAIDFASDSSDQSANAGLDLSGEIGLEDSAAPADSFLGGSALGGSALGGSALGGSALGGSGISAFDSAAGAPGDDLLDDDLSLETVGSGSGLLDLTRESDDTSLGAELIEEVYSSDDSGAPASASGLFEAVGGDGGSGLDDIAAPVGGMAAVPVVVEAYEGGWSGLGVGMGIVAVAALSLVALMAFVTGNGTLPAIAEMMTSNLTVWAGGLVGGLLVFGLLGFFIGKASE